MKTLTAQPAVTNLPATARYLAARHTLVDASAYWAKVHDDILSGQIQPERAGTLAAAASHQHQQLLAQLNAAGAMLTTIFTDHVNRAYWLIDDQGQVLADFPWGPDGRQQATIAQLQIEHPQALALAQRAEHLHPQLNGRALRAAQLVANHNVAGNPDQGYQVLSQNGRGVYEVSSDHVCTCHDWRKGLAASSSNGAAGKAPGAPRITDQIVCKHVLATRIYERTCEASRSDSGADKQWHSSRYSSASLSANTSPAPCGASRAERRTEPAIRHLHPRGHRLGRDASGHRH